MKYDLKDIINKINFEELKEFLYLSLVNDDYLLNKFRIEFNHYFPKMDKQKYEEKINDTISCCCDKRGYISYENTYQYEHLMLEHIDEAEKLLDNKDYQTAFILVRVVLDSIPNTAIDDSNGSTGMIADECIYVIRNILDNLDDEDILIEEILDDVLDEIKSLDLYNYGIDLYEVVEYFIQRKLYLEKIKNVFKEVLEFGNKESFIAKKCALYLKEIGTK